MAWKNKDHPNMHFLFYEDLKTDVMKELRTLNEFLGTRLTQQQLDNVIEHTSFSSMKNRSIKNPEIYLSAQKKKDGFFRKGETGDWKNHLSPEMDQQMNLWIENNSTDITFR
ncbi:sulfotransferase 1E1-like [Procambarus clarkii]|uniref:sulfotransferase 1E1-like n=1 Tax=Procambarus clarkii TaxID=6728 RepID=UPI0037427353